MNPPRQNGPSATENKSPREIPAFPNDSDAPRRFPTVSVILVVAIVVGVGVGLARRSRERVALLGEQHELSVPSVTVVSPAPGNPALATQLSAEVRAFAEAPIYARASGYVKRWLVDIGEKVAAGQLLAEIDTPEISQELGLAQAQLKQAEAALALAKISAARWAELLKTASVSEQEAAEKQADLALKSASVEAAQANVRRLEETKSFSKLLAPFAGTITLRRVDVGDLIRADATRELFRLAQTDTLRIFVHVPQTSARSVAAGQMADVVIPEIPGRVFKAKVARTSGALDPGSRTLLTELTLDNAKGEILAGCYAQVRLDAAKSEPFLALPSNCVLLRPDGPQVGVVLADGKVEIRPVKPGRDFGPTIEILEGVSVGDRVIANPSDFLVNGMTVRIAEAPKSNPAK